MVEFELHKYSGMTYEPEQIITFSKNGSMALPDIDKKMKFHVGMPNVEVRDLTQEEFDYFITNYGDIYESI